MSTHENSWLRTITLRAPVSLPRVSRGPRRFYRPRGHRAERLRVNTDPVSVKANRPHREPHGNKLGALNLTDEWGEEVTSFPYKSQPSNTHEQQGRLENSVQARLLAWGSTGPRRQRTGRGRKGERTDRLGHGIQPQRMVEKLTGVLVMAMGYSLFHSKPSKKEQREKNKRFKAVQGRMRRFPTAAEKSLNSHCHALGFKTEPQKTMCGYILDLYLPQLTVGIEADGGYHDDPDQIAKDAARTRNINRKFPGMVIIRYANEAILSEPDFRNRLESDLLRASGFTQWPEWVKGIK